jgi:hypothetical protein
MRCGTNLLDARQLLRGGRACVLLSGDRWSLLFFATPIIVLLFGFMDAVRKGVKFSGHHHLCQAPNTAHGSFGVPLSPPTVACISIVRLPWASPPRYSCGGRSSAVLGWSASVPPALVSPRPKSGRASLRPLATAGLTTVHPAHSVLPDARKNRHIPLLSPSFIPSSIFTATPALAPGTPID